LGLGLAAVVRLAEVMVAEVMAVGKRVRVRGWG
jgi:hypothetical protein